MNEKTLVVIIAVVLIALVAILTCIGIYNGLVNADVTVENMQGRVQTAYQRRADLIPNLVETVKGARDFEKSTQTEIAELRSRAGEIQVQAYNAQSVNDLQSVDASMSSVLSRLMVIVESYPELNANENFLKLQDELAGTENRIKYERDEYNNAVRNYKLMVRSFPSNIFAGMFGFNVDKWQMFESAPGAQNAPKVDFNT